MVLLEGAEIIGWHTGRMSATRAGEFVAKPDNDDVGYCLIKNQPAQYFGCRVLGFLSMAFWADQKA